MLPNLNMTSARNRSSERGLSMHEMHRHPATRNLKRAQNTSRRNTRSVSRASVWSKEETELLIKLNERYKHFKQPNVALQEYFPDKTLKQINDKRNAPARSKTFVVKDVAQRMTKAKQDLLPTHLQIEHLRIGHGGQKRRRYSANDSK